MTRKAARVSPPELPPIAGVTLAAEGSTIIVKRHSILILLNLLVLTGFRTPASAQHFWDWGGRQERGASGRELVRFNPQFAPGEIIVSFGDRRLYFVDRPGVTISYPIAIPRDQDRWEGVTSVSDKKINPTWRPTTDILAENSHLPPFVPGWPPTEPARRARALSRKQRLSHPRHGCALDHRHRRLQVALAACFAPGPLPDANTHKVWDLAK
jgi:hypothetical protein